MTTLDDLVKAAGRYEIVDHEEDGWGVFDRHGLCSAGSIYQFRQDADGHAARLNLAGVLRLLSQEPLHSVVDIGARVSVLLAQLERDISTKAELCPGAASETESLGNDGRVVEKAGDHG